METDQAIAARSTQAARGRTIGFQTLDDEVRDVSLPVQGSLPSWLGGMFLRPTPAMLDVGTRSLGHWFDGLAMLHAFSMRAGEVTYSNRFVDTEAYRAAREKGRVLAPITMSTDPCRRLGSRIMSIFAPFSKGPKFAVYKENPNVNIYKLGERYLVATESAVPIEFDPGTLAALGPVKLGDGRLNDAHGPFAHPHFDVHGSGDMIGFVTRVGLHNEHRLFTLAPGSNRRRHFASVRTGAKPNYMHSFALTERHMVLVEQPLTYNLPKIVRSGRIQDGFDWQPELGTLFTVVDRNTGEVLRQHTSEAFFHWHQANAFERDGELVVDLVAADDPSSVWDLDLDKLRDPDHRPRFHGALRRFRVPLGGGEIRSEQLSAARMEFPRINYGRVNALPYRYAYAVAYAGEDSDWFDEVVKVDVESGAEHRWSEPGCYPSEPVYVAAPSAAGEDDGVLLTVVLDSRAGRSFLLALDARDLTELARAVAPHHVPFNFHQDYFA